MGQREQELDFKIRQLLKGPLGPFLLLLNLLPLFLRFHVYRIKTMPYRVRRRRLISVLRRTRQTY